GRRRQAIRAIGVGRLTKPLAHDGPRCNGWQVGGMECWSSGVLENWSLGVFDYWVTTPSLHHSITPAPETDSPPFWEGVKACADEISSRNSSRLLHEHSPGRELGG